MSTVQKVAVIFAITGLGTALVLPGRQTAQVTKALGSAVSQWQGTSMGTRT